MKNMNHEEFLGAISILGDRRDFSSSETWNKIVKLCAYQKNELLSGNYSTSYCGLHQAMVCYSLLNTLLSLEEGSEDFQLYVSAFWKAVKDFDKIVGLQED